MYRGHEFARIHGDPYRWPHGYAYRHWDVGYRMPPVFLVRDYYVDYSVYGLEAPEPGFQWLRYGPDLVLVSLATGEIVQCIEGAYE
jgi:Ni/Co efflux regulator RcnB